MIVIQTGMEVSPRKMWKLLNPVIMCLSANLFPIYVDVMMTWEHRLGRNIHRSEMRFLKQMFQPPNHIMSFFQSWKMGEGYLFPSYSSCLYCFCLQHQTFWPLHHMWLIEIVKMANRNASYSLIGSPWNTSNVIWNSSVIPLGQNPAVTELVVSRISPFPYK